MKRLPLTPASIPRCVSNMTSPCISAVNTPRSNTPPLDSSHQHPLPGALTLPPSTMMSGEEHAHQDHHHRVSGGDEAPHHHSSYFTRYLNSWLNSTATTTVNGCGSESIMVESSRHSTPILGCAANPPHDDVNTSCLSNTSAATSAATVTTATGGGLMRRGSTFSGVAMSCATASSTYECRRSLKTNNNRQHGPAPRGTASADVDVDGAFMRWAKTPTSFRATTSTLSAAYNANNNDITTPPPAHYHHHHHRRAIAEFKSPTPPADLLLDEDELGGNGYNFSGDHDYAYQQHLEHSPTFERLAQRKCQDMPPASEVSEMRELLGASTTRKKSKKKETVTSTKKFSALTSTVDNEGVATAVQVTAAPRTQTLCDDPYGELDARNLLHQESTTMDLNATKSASGVGSRFAMKETLARNEYMKNNAARLAQYKADVLGQQQGEKPISVADASATTPTVSASANLEVKKKLVTTVASAVPTSTSSTVLTKPTTTTAPSSPPRVAENTARHNNHHHRAPSALLQQLQASSRASSSSRKATPRYANLAA